MFLRSQRNIVAGVHYQHWTLGESVRTDGAPPAHRRQTRQAHIRGSRLLSELIEPGKEEVAWQDIAEVLTVARFCGQLSELAIAEYWYERTALKEITGIAPRRSTTTRSTAGSKCSLPTKIAFAGT